MALADPTTGAAILMEGQGGLTGSGKSDWIAVNRDITAVNTASLLRPTLSTGAGSIVPKTIPPRCTRVLLKLQITGGTATAVTFTTQPLVTVWGVDANGVPTRLDNVDASAAGFSFAAATANLASNAANDTRYSNVYSLTGFDCLGDSTLYVLISQAAAGANFVGSVLAKFLN
jgi:hypothetical protein